MSEETKPAETPEPAATAENPLEKRLSALIGTQKDLIEKDAARNSEIGELKQLIASLATKLDTPRTPSAPPATPADPFSPVQSVANPTPQDQSFLDTVNKAVQDALAPLTSAATQRNEQLHKHRLSYAKVVERNPAFADPSTEEARLFNQLYEARQDLHAIGDAPAIIAEAVRGLLSDKRNEEQAKELAKIRATFPSAGGRDPGSVEAPDQIRTRFDKLVEKMQTVGNLTPAELGDYLQLKTAVAHLEAGKS